jgi:predicted amidophosphoribosyltransferase
MAVQNLIACPDCDKQVSRIAESCPHCGRPLKRRQTAGGFLAAMIIGLILCWGIVTFVVPYIKPH